MQHVTISFNCFSHYIGSPTLVFFFFLRRDPHWLKWTGLSKFFRSACIFECSHGFLYIFLICFAWQKNLWPAAVRLTKVVSLVNLGLKLMVGMCPVVLAFVFVSVYCQISIPHPAVFYECMTMHPNCTLISCSCFLCQISQCSENIVD